MLHLQVLGPAFGLPSIDTECIAAVALLRLNLRCDASKWTVSTCQTHSEGLPCLHDGDSRISGFDAIAKHLLVQHNKSDARTTADEIAITSLIRARAPPLISAYLYVSSENWNRVTRSAFTPILTPFTRFWLPGALRTAAKDCIAHLGITTVEADVHDDRRLDGTDSSFEAATRQRASLLLPSKSTVQDLLAKKEGAATFKLHALADSLFAPLQDMLGEKDWLLEDGPQQLDCLAYGYLSIMYEANMPSNWLATILKEKYPSLAAYTRRMRDKLRLKTVIADLYDQDRSQVAAPSKYEHAAATSKLPWTFSRSTALDQTGFVQLLSNLLPALYSSAVRTDAEPADPQILTTKGGALAAAALSALAGAAFLARSLWQMQYGQPVQIFGQRPVLHFNHVSHALSALNMIFQPAVESSTLDINPDHIDVPIAEVSLEAEP